jgi:hypothetical protein
VGAGVVGCQASGMYLTGRPTGLRRMTEADASAAKTDSPGRPGVLERKPARADRFRSSGASLGREGHLLATLGCRIGPLPLFSREKEPIRPPCQAYRG